jgi:hypothetical protein
MAQPGSTVENDVDGRGEPAAAARRQDGDTFAKSYRYLRLAMVGLLLCLAMAVVHQSLRQGGLLGSVSAYYYTPAQAFFVGGLIGLGACMIALKGTNIVEDVALNLGGVFAAIVAIVPTGRNADYEAARSACQEAGTPLLTEKASTGLNCPTVQALADATKANVDNNLFALIVVGFLALVLSLFVARRDGTLGRRANGAAQKNFWRGFGVALALWLVVLIARLASLQWVIDNGHWIAAVLLFACIFVVAVANARRVETERSGDGSQSAMKEFLDAARGLIARRRRGDRRYIWIARVMLLTGAVTIALWKLTGLSLFWVEACVFLLFMAFWTVQTFELESRQLVILRKPTTADRSSS